MIARMGFGSAALFRIAASVAGGAFGLAPAGGSERLAGPYPAKVERILDGDTLGVRVAIWLDQELSVLVRVRGIDAPELRGQCASEKERAREAKLVLERLLSGKAVVLTEIEGDKYFGRVVANVATSAGEDLGAALIAGGHARRYDGGARQGWCELGAGEAPSGGDSRNDLHASDPRLDRVRQSVAIGDAKESGSPKMLAKNDASNAISPDDIRSAEALIRRYIRRTPVMEVDAADFGLPPRPLVLKLELFQHAGSFKPRGAFANLLTRAVPAAGVAAASGGNHGAAVAYAAMKLGHKASIFVPAVSPKAKLDRIRSYGADLVIAGDRYVEALAASEEFAEETGALRVHAYDQRETLIGQGTLGLELEEQEPKLDTLLVAVGGGGLIGGIAAWYRGRTKIIGVEPALAPTLHMAFAAGEPVDAPAGGIAADSLAPKRVGSLMFPIAQKFVERVVLVEDEEIRAAQLALWDRVRIVSEPGGAAAFAALLSGRYRPAPGERVGIVLCGGNTGAVDFGR